MKYLNLFLIGLCLPMWASAQCWNLVWADEFDGTAVDGGKWSYQTGAGGWGNNELQAYTDRVDNSTVSGGTLKIIAKSETYGGANYTSARMRSIGNGDWTYGKFEASIRLPIGQGIWPAFWMMPTDNVYGGWPSSGEIDIMEYLGHQPTIAYGTAHWGNSPGDKGSSGGSLTNATGDYTDGFYTYTVEWDANQIRWYVDGTQFHTLNKTDIPAGYFWPFDYDFHFILNVAVGGNWPGPPDGTTVFPQTMEVDYVRVYQLLPDIQIVGQETVEPGSTGKVYTVPDMPGTTYTWSLPAGASISAGAGTHEITVDWGSASGPVEVVLNNGCGTSTSSLDVLVTANLAPNPGFEFDYSQWFSDLFNGAWANFSINTSDYHSGAKSACAQVTNLNAAAWEIQLSPAVINTTFGEDYTLSFWAKADVNNRQMSVALINNNNFTYYGGQTYTLTDQWAQYTYFYTAAATAPTQINLEFGHELGTFCIDDFSFARTAALPVELISFTGNYVGNERVLLEWETAWEEDFSHYEIQRFDRVAGRFIPLGEVLGNGGPDYAFHDHPPLAANQYRLRLVDADGTYSYSPVVHVDKKAQKSILLYPSPVSNQLFIETNDHDNPIYIFDHQGRLVREFPANALTRQGMDVGDLQRGVYLLKQGETTQRFVKQ